MATVNAARVAELNDNLRRQIFERGGSGLHAITRAFRLADNNGNKHLDREEFTEALNYAGLFLSSPDTTAIWNFYDRNRDGNVNLDEFLRGLRGELNERRNTMVNRVFESLDRDRSGVLDRVDVQGFYNAAKHPRVKSGEITAHQALDLFLQGFEGKSGNNDGVITRNEFIDYYTDLSASVPDDAYCVYMMESVWMMRESTAAENDEVILALEVQLREKVRQKSRGNNESDTLRKVFKHFDADEGGVITIDEFNRAMERFGVSVMRRDTTALFARYDRDNSGTISFEEFVANLYRE